MRALIPWTLIAVNVIAIVAAALNMAAWLRRQGASGWWSLGLALQPAFAYAVLADLSDALAVAALVGGLIAYWERRRWSAAALLSLAALLFGLTLPWMVFGGSLSYTRLSAPMFGCLLLAAVRRRSRPALALCAAVAALGPLVALGIG